MGFRKGGELVEGEEVGLEAGGRIACLSIHHWGLYTYNYVDANICYPSRCVVDPIFPTLGQRRFAI